MSTAENTAEAIQSLKYVAGLLARVNVLLEHPRRMKEMRKKRKGDARSADLRSDMLQERMEWVDRSLATLRLFLDGNESDPLIIRTLNRVPPKREVPWYLWHFSLASPAGLRFNITRFKTVYGLIFNLLYLLMSRDEWSMLKYGTD